MKLIKRCSLASALLLCSTGFAGGDPKPGSTLSTELRKSLHAAISYPDFARDKRLCGSVRVTFEVSSDGKLQVINSTSIHPDLARYVVAKLEAIQTEQIASIGVHAAKFNFQFVE